MEEKNKCPVCDSELNSEAEWDPHSKRGNISRFSCPLCGEFEVSDTLTATKPDWAANDLVKSTKISHALRRMQENNKVAYLDSYSKDKILGEDLPSPKEQADLLIRWLGEKIEYFGEYVSLDPKEHRTLVGSVNLEGFTMLWRYLEEKELVTVLASSLSGCAKVTLTMDGWEYFDRLIHGAITNRKAFMAMKYGDPVLNCVYRAVFKKAVDDAGFALFKSNENLKMGLIDNKMRAEIQTAAFVVVDLTHDNSGAYWEAGYAEGLGKNVIYTCEAKKFDEMKTHFDTNHHLTIPWDEEEPDKAGEELKASIRATLPHLAKMED